MPSLRRKNRIDLKPASRMRALPWAALLQVLMVLRARWLSLSAKDRARIAELLRESQGRVGNLSSRQREELRKLVGKLDPKGAARELAPIVRGKGRKGR